MNPTSYRRPTLESALTDATPFMFDKLLGSMSRKAERQTAEKNFETLREVYVHNIRKPLDNI
jgi:hypothetical protein